MCEAFSEAREVLAEADDVLGFPLSKMCFEGPDADLALTENTQPAILAVSIAALRVVRAHGVTSEAAAGHSLGEYSALVAADALELGAALELVRSRGRYMQEAVPVGEGAMAALLGAELDDAKRLAKEASEGEVCQAANDNAPGQIVISGTAGAVGRAIEMAADYGARRAVLLPVSAPFHCALMQPAAQVMAEALGAVEIKPPAVPLIANVTAREADEPEQIREQLVQQVTGMVRWRESVGYMVENGVRSLYEIGAGRVLTGLARRIERDLDAKSVATPDEIDAAIESLEANT